MRILFPLAGLATAAAALLSAGMANAGDQGNSSAGIAARPVLVCTTDAATRRAFTREHGTPPVFVTAREALSVRASDPAWSTPRCMTPQEHARYREAAATYAAVRQSPE